MVTTNAVLMAARCKVPGLAMVRRRLLRTPWRWLGPLRRREGGSKQRTRSEMAPEATLLGVSLEECRPLSGSHRRRRAPGALGYRIR